MENLRKSTGIIFLLILMINISSSFASNKSVQGKSKAARLMQKADRSYERYAYKRAAKLYKKSYDISTDPKVALQIANCYRFMNRPIDSETWYREAINQGGDLPEEDMIQYAQVLRANAKYKEALVIYDKYKHTDDWLVEHVEALGDVERFYVNQIAFDIKESIFNTKEKDFSPTYKNDTVVFTTARKSSGLFKPQYEWDGTNFLDLFEVKGAELPRKLPRRINTRYHEGPATFFDNGNKVYFTRNNYHKMRAGQSKKGVNMLKIYYTEKKRKNKWKRPKPFKYNNNDYSTGHPTISRDGKIMIFASDMPGGFGGVDLYRTEYVNGEWSKPVNLGEKFNTAQNEVFPHLHDDGLLYFASNGKQGLGGLDVFRAGLDDNLPIKNLGYPLNTKVDDFGIGLQEGVSIGYFSSNREGGTGDDDIYNVTIYDYVITINLLDSLTGMPIKGIIETNEIYPSGSKELIIKDENVQSSLFRSLKGSKFTSLGSAVGYLPNDITIVTKNNSNDIKRVSYDIKLMPIEKPEVKIKQTVMTLVQNNGATTQVIWKDNDKYSEYAGTVGELKKELSDKGIGIANVRILKNIYYDFDKYNIRTDAVKDLDKLYSYMLEHPNINVLLSSHTDSRGSHGYNDKLGENRSQSARAYLLKKGISKERIEIDYHGERKLVNHCKNDVDCHGDHHQENRRTEIYLVLPKK